MLEVVVVSKEQKDFVSNDRFKALKKQYQKQGEEYRQTRNRLQEALDSLDEKDARYQDLKAQYDVIHAYYIKHLDDENKITEELRKIAEELALTDFQSLDTLQQRISELRWNGDWEEIESYIRSTMNGSAEAEIPRIRQAKVAADVQVEEATAKLKAGLLAQKIAEQEEKDWFFKMESLIEKFKVSHENDSVSKYYKSLIDAAPENWEYLNEAGRFECDYMADYAKGFNYYNRAIASNPTDTWLAACYNNIGWGYHRQGDYSKALEYHEKAMKIKQSIFEENHPRVATSYNNIGNVYISQGNCDKALEYYEKSLKIWLSALGEKDSDVAVCYNNIGFVYWYQGDYAKALEYCEKALKIQLSVFGEHHPDVATSYNNIGTVYVSHGNNAKALEYFEKALKTRLLVLGEHHPDVATSYYNVSLVCNSLGDYAKALEYLEAAKRNQVSIWGESNPKTIAIKRDLNVCYYKYAIEKNDVERLGRLIAYGTIIEGGAASRGGMTGEYYILGFGDWTIENIDKNIFDVNEKMRGMAKDVVFYRNGVISKGHFENVIGIQIGINEIESSEKAKIVEKYRKWKNSNK